MTSLPSAATWWCCEGRFPSSSTSSAAAGATGGSCKDSVVTGTSWWGERWRQETIPRGSWSPTAPGSIGFWPTRGLCSKAVPGTASQHKKTSPVCAKASGRAPWGRQATPGPLGGDDGERDLGERGLGRGLGRTAYVASG